MTRAYIKQVHNAQALYKICKTKEQAAAALYQESEDRASSLESLITHEREQLVKAASMANSISMTSSLDFQSRAYWFAQTEHISRTIEGLKPEQTKLKLEIAERLDALNLARKETIIMSSLLSKAQSKAKALRERHHNAILEERSVIMNNIGAS